MTFGAKLAVVLMSVAAISLATGISMLILGAQTPDAVPRADIDLDEVAKRFESQVTALDKLPELEASLNADELYEGEGALRLSLLSDCSVLGWVDKDGNNQPDTRYSPDEAANIDVDDDPPDTPEVIFRLRAEKEGQRLLLADRYHTMREHKVSDTFASSATWRDTLACQRGYYGEDRYYRAPRTWIFVPYGYYGGWSSARTSSLGRRYGSGGVSAGK